MDSSGDLKREASGLGDLKETMNKVVRGIGRTLTDTSLGSKVRRANRGCCVTAFFKFLAYWQVLFIFLVCLQKQKSSHTVDYVTMTF